MQCRRYSLITSSWTDLHGGGYHPALLPHCMLTVWQQSCPWDLGISIEGSLGTNLACFIVLIFHWGQKHIYRYLSCLLPAADCIRNPLCENSSFQPEKKSWRSSVAVIVTCAVGGRNDSPGIRVAERWNIALNHKGCFVFISCSEALSWEGI